MDYRVDGVDIQSKYYNGLRNTLDGVASHAEKYPGFPDGPGRYHIPRDQHRQLDEFLRTGGIEGQSDRSASALQRRVDDLERTTDRPADDLIEPGDASYAEVQRGRVHDTLRNREDRLTHENEELERTARVEHGPIHGWVRQGRESWRRGRGWSRLGPGNLDQVPRGPESLPRRVLDLRLAGRWRRSSAGWPVAVRLPVARCIS